MNIKTLPLLLISSITLVACGGSDSDSHGWDGGIFPPSNIEQWTGFDFEEIRADKNKGALGYNADVWTIQKDNVLVQNINTLSDPDPSYSTFTVTVDGVYSDGPQDKDYGTYLGNLKTYNSDWTLSLYSPIKSQGFQQTRKQNLIDLSGKDFSTTVDPYNAWIIKNNAFNTSPVDAANLRFYQNNVNQVFPAGSKCLQLVEVSSNQEHIELDINSKNMSKVKDIWYQSAASNQVKKKYFKDTEAYISYQYPDADTYAKYLNDFYSGDYQNEGINYSLADEVQDQKDQANRETGEARRVHLALADVTANACTLYNETAARFIISRLSLEK